MTAAAHKLRTITSPKYGMYALNTGSLLNALVIFRPSTGVSALVNAAGAVIDGGSGTGVAMPRSGTLINAGSINGGLGIRAVEGISLTNQATGIISGSVDGTTLYGSMYANNVVNAGSIYGGSLAVRLGSGTLTNSGTVLSPNTGVYGHKSTTVYNTGVIGGASANGIHLQGGGLVSNQAGGTISGAVGVYVQRKGGVSNDSTIIGTGASGTGVIDVGGTVMNSGTINAGLTGVKLMVGASFTNTSTGFVRGVQYGVYSETRTGTFTNAGSISATGWGYGVIEVAGGTITNTSTGTITAAYGVRDVQVGTVINAGLITGDYQGKSGAGVYLQKGGLVTNSGTISAIADGVYTYQHSTAKIVNTGVIMSDTGIGVQLGGGGTVINDGTIASAGSKAVYMGSASSNLVVIDPGAVFQGLVQSGSPAVSTIDLASGSSAGTIGSIGGAGSQFLGFSRVDIMAGASWTLAGSTAIVFLGGGGDSVTLGSGNAVIGAGSTLKGGDTINLGTGVASVVIAKNLTDSVVINGFTATDTINFTGFGTGASITALGGNQYQVGTAASHELLTVNGVSLAGHTTLA